MTNNDQLNFEEYLRIHYDNDISEFDFRSVASRERVVFFIRPKDTEGDPATFAASGGIVKPTAVETEDDLQVKICRDYYPFPQTQPKFHLGQLVRSIEFERPGVVVGVGSDLPALEWTYLVIFSNSEGLKIKVCWESSIGEERLTNK